MKKKAVISVSDKEGIVKLGKGLTEKGYEILATGNTAKVLIDSGIDCVEISDYTGFPEIFSGRVKTLHPKIFGGILFRRTSKEDLLQATYYYRYYLFEAIKKVNAPELFSEAQRPWEGLIADHMTTTLERFESKEKPTRSEVHPWSASPAYFYFNYLAGIRSAKNSYEEIHIRPAFGELNNIEGIMPTPHGNIIFHLKRKGKKLMAEITIPDDMKGEIFWNEKSMALSPGNKSYNLN